MAILTGELQRPSRLRGGDRIAAVTLSWGGPGEIPHRYEAGKRQLEEAFGVTVVEMPHTLADPEFVADHPQARADDLHQALADPDIAGIVSPIGGDDSIRLLPHLDLELVAANPKVFLGYSDTTVTQMAFLRADVVSFYGPAIMAGFAENGGIHPYLREGVRRMLFEPEAPLDWPENREGWTVEFVDWLDPSSQNRRRTRRPSSGWRWLGGEPTEGTLVAGCLEAVDWLRGTDWWPDLDGPCSLLKRVRRHRHRTRCSDSFARSPRGAISSDWEACSSADRAAPHCHQTSTSATTRPSSGSFGASRSSRRSRSCPAWTSGTPTRSGRCRRAFGCVSTPRPNGSPSSRRAWPEPAKAPLDARGYAVSLDSGWASRTTIRWRRRGLPTTSKIRPS